MIKYNFNKKAASVLTAVTISCTVWSAAPVLADTEVQKYTNTDFAMDTVVSETLYTTGDDLNAEIGNKLREIESGLLSWTVEDSQISKLNAAAGETTEVSDELAGYLAKIEQLAGDSDGAFDPTLGKVIRLWDIDGEDPHVPEASELDALLKDVGYQKVTLDGNKVTLAKDTTLDLGAVGKGIGCDVISEFLKDQKEVEGMILNLGGSSVFGVRCRNRMILPWKVAVTDPQRYRRRVPWRDYDSKEESTFLHQVITKNISWKTARRYHHILDPKTGYPVWNGLDSVTIVCDNGLLADGLSTACFVLGMDDAMELLEKYDANAMFVDEDKNIYLTDGMKDRFELMKNTYTVNTTK